MYDIIYNNQSGFDLGMLAVTRPSIPAPEPRYEPYEIPGRDGILMPVDIPYNNIEIEINFNFMSPDPERWGECFRKAKHWIRGNGTLRFYDDADIFYRVVIASITSVERTSRRIGNFTAVFVCEPWTYRVQGQKEMNIEDVLYNPYDVSHPLYHVTASGAYTLTVNGTSFTGSKETFIDTDLMIAYNKNQKIVNTTTIGDFADLYLQEGENSISIEGGTLMVKPRWREL